MLHYQKLDLVRREQAQFRHDGLGHTNSGILRVDLNRAKLRDTWEALTEKAKF